MLDYTKGLYETFKITIYGVSVILFSLAVLGIMRVIFYVLDNKEEVTSFLKDNINVIIIAASIILVFVFVAVDLIRVYIRRKEEAHDEMVRKYLDE